MPGKFLTIEEVDLLLESLGRGNGTDGFTVDDAQIATTNGTNGTLAQKGELWLG